MCSLPFKLHASTSSTLTDRIAIAAFFSGPCLKGRLAKLETKWPVPVYPTAEFLMTSGALQAKSPEKVTQPLDL